jgi:outer membrane protein OmpA-like peptidoglycan-associated protein
MCVCLLTAACGGSGAKPVEVKKEVIVTLGDVLFDKNKSDLKPEARETLKSYSGRLTGVKNEILIDGYCDNSGTPAFNMTLSQKRADTVKKCLVDVLGVEASRVTAKGYGIANPAFPNTTEENRKKNRRVVVTILPLNQD